MIKRISFILDDVQSTIDLFKFFVIGILFIINLLPLIAPVLSFFGEKNFSSFIYWLYQFFCHQKASRSFFICDNQCGWCARCMFIWFSLLVSAGISFYFFKDKKFQGIGFILMLLLCLPLIIDGGVQLIASIYSTLFNIDPFYESNNSVRAFTGILFGLGLGLFIFPRLNYTYEESER